MARGYKRIAKYFKKIVVMTQCSKACCNEVYLVLQDLNSFAYEHKHVEIEASTPEALGKDVIIRALYHENRDKISPAKKGFA